MLIPPFGFGRGREGRGLGLGGGVEVEGLVIIWLVNLVSISVRRVENCWWVDMVAYYMEVGILGLGGLVVDCCCKVGGIEVVGWDSNGFVDCLAILVFVGGIDGLVMG
ncbi:hypothetical protein PIB30_058059 [Stylosanthes scabra]|uniref:Transmembrane protein n=1 Tax=Stylosanthes scabra TaxID=79078 RepID=A0ABU6YK46_9FABA|nr:hypothetical protein [Stylosanthes scabra]